jgi:MoxR-like ATPase
MSDKIVKADIGKVREASLAIFLIKKEIAKAFFGQEHVVDSLIRSLLCNGHILLEGVPGIAKTHVIKVLSRVSGCSFSRIQFTADLLPSDILGMVTYNPQKGFEISKGPIFANFVIADEINRSPPKTQSSLMEAMQERQVTISKDTFDLPDPFFVMATQNPIETEGVYSLPEAQVDRFLFKVDVSYPKDEHEFKLMDNNSTYKKMEDYKLNNIISPSSIVAMQRLTHEVYSDPKIKNYVLEIVKKSRSKDFHLGNYVELGCSPRASIALYQASKAEALMNGRNFVIPSDVKAIAKDVLRHRLILTYKARADKVTSDMVVEEILKEVSAV